MSMVHLKTRKQTIAANKKAKDNIKIKWNIQGEGDAKGIEIEVVQPKEAPGCFETSKHAGIFFDGSEQLAPGLLGNRMGFVRDDHHYQITLWEFKFSHPGQKRETGKFILLVDGWEVESGVPVNAFFRSMYTRLFLSGAFIMLLGGIGIAGVTVADSPVLNGFLGRMFLIMIPIALYYMYAGMVGMIKFHLRMRLDETGPPWWNLDDVFQEEDDPADPAAAAEEGLVTVMEPSDQPSGRQRLVTNNQLREGSGGKAAAARPSPLQNELALSPPQPVEAADLISL